MEDEEHYHLMIEDLERLERVHHHREPDAQFLQWEARQQESVTNPWVSGIRFAISGAVKAGIEAAKRTAERRRSVASSH